MRWKPNVTVAAIIEKDGRFLMVEENAGGQRVINQPAGHLEKDESLLAAVKREVLEETAWEFEAEKVTGIYLYPSPGNDTTYLRICFSGKGIHHHPSLALDDGIIQALWMTRSELENKAPRLRSPLVLQCIDDHLAGKQYPLDIMHYIDQK